MFLPSYSSILWWQIGVIPLSSKSRLIWGVHVVPKPATDNPQSSHPQRCTGRHQWLFQMYLNVMSGAKNSCHNPTISEEMGQRAPCWTKSALLLNPFQNGCVVTHAFKHKIVRCLRKHSWHLPPIRNPAIWDSCDACASEILRQQRGATTDHGLRPCEHVHWFLCSFYKK